MTGGKETRKERDEHSFLSERAGSGGSAAAVVVALENPDDAADATNGNRVGPRMCHAQPGRDRKPTSGLCSFPLSCINAMVSIRSYQPSNTRILMNNDYAKENDDDTKVEDPLTH
ncbi:hypothetical protein BHE74_00037177 [Ensete ventricosum]|nr:hypothetical protein GW17_00046630 [Ensete ventricosum]RWW56119.1 hypothetical protein BHE74_00037177 [Ensete ventricosum]